MNILSGEELQVNPLNTFLNGLSFPHTYLFYLLHKEILTHPSNCPKYSFLSLFYRGLCCHFPLTAAPANYWGCSVTPIPSIRTAIGPSVPRTFCGSGWEREGLASLRWHSVMEMEGIVKWIHHSASVCVCVGGWGVAFCSAGAHTESNIKVEKVFVVQVLRKPEFPTLILPLMSLDSQWSS